MAFSSGSSSSFSADINVTPLIDVLLVLLIIFMVIVPVMSRGIDSAVPQDHNAKAESTLSPLVVQVLSSRSGAPPHYRINQNDVMPGDLRPALQRVLAARQDRTLFVQADRDLNYGEVAAAVGEGRAAGAGAIALLSTPRK